MHRTLLAVILVLLASAGQAVAQTGLRAGQTVRVRLHDGPRLEGRLVAVDTAPAVLRFADHEAPVPLASVDSLWLRGTKAGTGAMIGGIIVGGASIAFWSALCIGLGEGGGCDSWGAVAGASAAGAAAGALLGAGLGSLSSRWRLIGQERVGLAFGPGPTGAALVVRVRF